MTQVRLGKPRVSTISSSLSFVHFPQKFHNISKHDIYDSRLKSAFEIWWQGLDGAKEPILSGCNFYIKRGSLYGNCIRKVIEGVAIRKDKGRIASPVALLSTVLSLIFWCLGSFFLMYCANM